MKERNLPIDPNGGALKGVRGMMLTFIDDPFLRNTSECYTIYNDGLAVIQDGRFIDVGEYADVIGKYNDLTDIDVYDNSLIIPGMIDCHLHYVQSPMIGSYGESLLEWLNTYTFPTESKFKDKKFADDVARIFFRQILSQGTTSANIFATTFASSVDAIFEESERYNTRVISGKVLQDRNLPDSLKDPDTEQSIIISENLMNKWHQRGRQLYAVIPRFAPTSTPEQLQLAGELYQRNRDRGVYMHTHLDEVQSEIDWVTRLFPHRKNYTDVYDYYGLIDRTSVLAHCCIVREEEWQTLHAKDCGVAHCPSSNLFLGDGEFKYWEAKNVQRPVRVGMATDVGGGTNFSVFRQLGEAYKVAMLQDHSLDAVCSLYLATRGAAQTLHLENTIGSIAPGYEADMAVIDLAPSEFASWRLQFSDDIWQKLFVLMTLGLDNTNRATYVAGKKVYDRRREQPFEYADQLK